MSWRCDLRNGAAILVSPVDVVSSADGAVRVEPVESENLLKPSDAWDRNGQVELNIRIDGQSVGKTPTKCLKSRNQIAQTMRNVARTPWFVPHILLCTKFVRYGWLGLKEDDLRE